MAIIIPSRNIFSSKNNKSISNKIGEINLSVYDTDLKEESFSTFFDANFNILSKEYIERTAIIKKIEFNIKDSLQFFELGETLDKNGFVTSFYKKILSEAESDAPLTETLENPEIGKTYTVYFKDFLYADDLASTTSLKFMLTDNLRAIISISESLPDDFTGKKSFYFNHLSANVIASVAKKSPDQISSQVYSSKQSNNVFRYDGNELIQTTAKTSVTNSDGETEDVRIDKYISNLILKEYQNGKETATIRCSISDYYDEKGIKKISPNTDRMTFITGDEVIPKVFGANGIDIPMSKYKDGTSKIFRVCGIKFIYDGAVWQELALQEVTKEV